MAKFAIMERTQTKGQDFDKENITFVKAGKKYNVYDLIQEGREDTEIYPTLEKYGCIDRLRLNTEEVYADVRGLHSLRNSMDKVNKANEIWLNLPVETRAEFNHSKREFVERGEKWLKDKIDAAEAAKKAQIEVPAEPVVKQEVKVNE